MRGDVNDIDMFRNAVALAKQLFVTEEEFLTRVKSIAEEEVSQAMSLGSIYLQVLVELGVRAREQ